MLLKHVAPMHRSIYLPSVRCKGWKVKSEGHFEGHLFSFQLDLCILNFGLELYFKNK